MYASTFEYRPNTSDKFETLNLTIASATPEPSTWLLMIAGIGGIGLMLRRAKKTTGFGSRDALSA